MRIFVTGGTGFLGCHFLSAALAAGHDVVALRRKGSVPRSPIGGQPSWIEGFLVDDLTDVLRRCDALVHLAAAGVVEPHASWDSLFRTNVMDSLRLWQHAVDAGVRRFIICGSCFEYGRSAERYDFVPVDAPLEPTGAYHASKAAASMAALALAAEQRLLLAIVRPFHVYGEGEDDSRFWPSLRAAALAGRDFPMTEGRQIRDFTPAADVATTIVDILAFSGIQPGRPIIRNIGSGQPCSLLEFAQGWWHHWNAKGRLVPGGVPHRANEVMRYVPDLTPPKGEHVRDYIRGDTP
jgi:nucleoside-diphosphate-sugar epimerase